ncbi:hypothetical protein CEE37_06855 [candidate division LCP-89 bacterium B3_LCP]|uniref:Outer membrane protein beta-barrel domain-containing protein n=1 Tax=candidate division LCP-89 bacterium B3_LCP TaxID=2012998 RepID=A0A532V0D3_UNCL8|nr:MAG: hypothetical protein CEE37_06855 [candidate division LCP-89 bacterium B3_LCP]
MRMYRKKSLFAAPLILLLTMFMIDVTQAQECGPSCPVCSGNSGGALLAPNSVSASGLAIPDAEEETAVFNVRYGLFEWIDAGVGYAVDTEKLLWSVRTQPIKEDESNWQPGIIIGTGSVQIGGSDQSVYLQASKSWEFSQNFALQMSGGVATLVPDFEEIFGLAGVTTSFFEKYSIFANYDGRNFHEGLSWIPLDWLTVSLLLIESSSPAASLTVNIALEKE